MSTIRIWIAAAALLALSAGGAAGQVTDRLWDGPVRLSTMDGWVLDRVVAMDSRGRAHAFWIEDRLFEGAHKLYYARFGGQTWTPPVAVEDLKAPFAGSMARVDAVIDEDDVIHLVWSPRSAPVFYRKVAVDRALSPSAWSEARKIPVAALKSKLFVDVQGALLLVYCPVPSVETGVKKGVFAVRSTDGGETWPESVQIDSEVPGDWDVQDVDADYDGERAVHVTWTYIGPGGYEVQQVRYARSLDGGRTWSAPSVIETAKVEDPYWIRLAVPEVKARGAEAHIIYAGGPSEGVGRRHLYSNDFGATWSQPQSMWAELHGAAGTDSAFFDSKGRLHLMAQVRFPAGVYHTIWERGAWSEPELVYLIAEDEKDVIGDRVHAQWFEAAVSADDRVVLLIESCAAGCQDDSTWPKNPITFALTSVGSEATPTFTSVPSPTFKGGQPLAPAAIAAGFGPGLNNRTVAATTLPLPERLDGLEVEITDVRNQRQLAPLLFVSPEQVNFLVPSDTATGLARVRVYRVSAENERERKLVSAGLVKVDRVSPAIYTANAQGTGAAAGTWLLVPTTGERTSGLLFHPQTLQPAPIRFDPSREQLYLMLYGTGMRGFREAQAHINGVRAPILYIGAQGQFDGLDQLNIGPVPRELATGGTFEVTVTVDGVRTNAVTMTIQR